MEGKSHGVRELENKYEVKENGFNITARGIEEKIEHNQVSKCGVPDPLRRVRLQRDESWRLRSCVKS